MERPWQCDSPSMEGIYSFLIEETKGIYPLWLAPTQVNIIPVNMEYHEKYAKEISKRLGYQN